MTLVRQEVPGLGLELSGSGRYEGTGSSRGHGKVRGNPGILVGTFWLSRKFRVGTEVPGDGSSGVRKFSTRPEIPGIANIILGRSLVSKFENRGEKTQFRGLKLMVEKKIGGEFHGGEARSTCKT